MQESDHSSMTALELISNAIPLLQEQERLLAQQQQQQQQQQHLDHHHGRTSRSMSGNDQADLVLNHPQIHDRIFHEESLLQQQHAHLQHHQHPGYPDHLAEEKRGGMVALGQAHGDQGNTEAEGMDQNGSRDERTLAQMAMEPSEGDDELIQGRHTHHHPSQHPQHTSRTATMASTEDEDQQAQHLAAIEMLSREGSDGYDLGLHHHGPPPRLVELPTDMPMPLHLPLPLSIPLDGQVSSLPALDHHQTTESSAIAGPSNHSPSGYPSSPTATQLQLQSQLHLQPLGTFTPMEYETFDELYEHVAGRAREEGFSVSIYNPTRSKKGVLRAANLRCSKSGKHRETRTTETRRRKAHSSKTDCPFNIYAHRIDPISNKFTFDIKSGDHNHLPDFERFRTRPIRRKVRSTPFRIEPEPQVVEGDEVKKVKKVRGKGKRKAGKGTAAGEPGEENAAVGGPMDHEMEFEPHVTPLHPSQHPDFGLLGAHHSHHQSAHHDPHHMGTGMDDDVNVDYGLDGTTLADMGERMEREQQMADEAEREGEEGERRHHPHHHGEDGEDHPHYHSHQSGQNGYAPGQAGYEQQHHEDATHHHHYEPESDVLDPVFQTAVGDEPEGGSNGVSDMRTKNGYEDPAGDAVAVADMANHEAMELGGMMGIGEMGQYQHPVEGVEGERYGEYEAGREHDAGQVVEALEHEEGGDGSATGAGDERQEWNGAERY